MDVRPNVLLQTALRVMRIRQSSFGSAPGASAVVFRSGQVPAGAQTMTTNLNNGWTVETIGVVDHGGVFGGGGGLPLAGSGMALSLLLGALIYVLGSGPGTFEGAGRRDEPTSSDSRRCTTRLRVCPTGP